jgi:hypothetical protein
MSLRIFAGPKVNWFEISILEIIIIENGSLETWMIRACN